MKKVFRIALILLLILALAAGVFACKKKKTNDKPSEEALAQAAVAAAIPNGEKNAEIASSLLSLLKKSGLEEAEIRASLLALTEKGAACALSLTDLEAHSYSTGHFESYQASLQAIANAVSPEVAGVVYYAAASEKGEPLPYTLSDCRKLASLLLGQDLSIEGELLNKLLEGDFSSFGEKQLNTLFLTLASSLRKAVGVSEQAKNYLKALAKEKFDDLLSTEELTEETANALKNTKTLLFKMIDAFIEGYDVILTYTADLLSLADAKLILGLAEKKETTVYYGYRKADWAKTLLTKAQFDAREGDYDEYIEQTAVVKGFTVNGEFLVLTDEDALLADRVYRLVAAYRAYLALSEENKTAFRTFVDAFLDVLADEPALVAALVDRKLIENSGAPAATFDELLAALPALLSFDAKDGVTTAEKSAATNALSLFERYLHGYLPTVY